MTTPHAAPSHGARRLPFHYGWVVVATGVGVMFACLGLARFSFGILLPPMAQGLGLDYTQRGAVGTGYFIGYLAMVALAPALARRIGNRRTVAMGLAVIALTMCLLGIAGNYPAALACYTLTGVGSGAANIAMMALVTAWFAPSMRGTATGLVLAGNGLGIVVSGFLVPHVVAAAALGWRAGWLVLGALAGTVCAAAWIFLRDTPFDAGRAGTGAPTNAAQAVPRAGRIGGAQRRDLVFLGVLYALFGLTYIIYGTFIVTTMIDEHGFAVDTAGRFWSWVGVCSLFSGALFGRLSDRVSRRAGLMAAFGTQTVAYALAALHMGTFPLYCSVACYGISAWSIPTIMAAAIADRVGPSRAASGFAFITLFFAVGQVAGPVGAGHLADLTGSFTQSYAASACLTGLAALLALRLRRTHGGNNQ
ncbi:MAG: MFS transporter [Desulfovibrionaceae bacterium]